MSRMEKASALARAEIVQHIGKYEFDGAVITTYDSEKQQATNFWTFHLHSFDNAQLQYIAYALASATAEQLRTEANNPGTRQINAAPKPRLYFKGPDPSNDPLTLAAVAIGWPDREKPVWLNIETMGTNFSFGISWYDGPSVTAALNFWSIRFLFGILSFRISRTV